jgi:ABC-2 type transport system permease protein
MMAVQEWRLVLHKECRNMLRDGRLRVLALALLALLLAALASGWLTAQRWHTDVGAASGQDRAAWLAQDGRNPHNAAHFGQMAFKPAGALVFFEPGISATVGRGVLMEAHNQNPATLRAAEQGSGRLGGLPAAWLLQIGLPLLVLVAGHALWAGERESGTLRLQLVQGGQWWPLLLGKAAALGLLAAAMWLPVALSVWWLSDDGSRATLVLAAYAGYALIWVGLTLAASAVATQARSSLGLLLVFWLLSAVVLPRILADIAERLHPSPSPAAFWADVRKAQREGVDGHNPADARAKLLLAETLKRYGVDKKAALSINFTGIAMQAGEDYGNQVFDRYYGALWKTYAAQDAVRLAASVLSPLPALQALSQAGAGTDWQQHRHFVGAAEAHRRALQRFLNDDFTVNARGLDFDYRADPTLWAKAPLWQYHRPALANSSSDVVLAAIILLFWAALASGLAVWAAQRLVRKGGR